MRGVWVKPKSIRFYLAAMALATSLPILMISGLWLYSELRYRQDTTAERIADTSAALSLAVDREIDSAWLVLRGLAQSRALARGDLAEFYQEALTARSLYPGADVVLADATGHQLMATFAPLGATLPLRNADVQRETLFGKGQPTVSNMFRGAVTGVLGFSVDVPVLRDGAAAYDLGMFVPATRLSAMLSELSLPTGWVGGVTDRNLLLLARSVEAEKYVGQRVGRPSSRTGTVTEIVRSVDGQVYRGGFTRSAKTGWTVSVLVPQASVMAGLWRWLTIDLVSLGLVALLSGLAAHLVAKRISVAVRALVPPAEALGRGEMITPPSASIKEVNAVADSLSLAANLLQQRDIDRAAAEEALRESLRTTEAMVAVAPLGVITVDANGIITRFNKAAETISGFTAEEIIGRAYGEPLPPVSTNVPPSTVMERVRRGEALLGVLSRRRRRDGTTYDLVSGISPLFDSSGTFMGAIMIGQDVTELLRTEEQLRQSQKMQAVGQLTGGIAHDFNNLLAIQIMSLDALAPMIKGNDPANELLGNILKAAERGATLTQRLLAFARRQVLAPRPIRLETLISEVAPLIRQTLGERIVLAIHIDPDTWPLFIDPVQLETSFINLAANARDAMPRGGQVTIAACNRQLNTAEAEAYGDVAAGDYILITVTDTGEGMTDAVRERVFEPFFTTKPLDQGVGLGLSMVFGFMSQSKGSVTVQSAPGAGTTFRLLLPRSPVPVPDQPPAATAAPAEAAGAKQIILIVEDNQGLREALARQVTALGYRYMTAADAEQAMALLEKQRFDLVFSDLVMPGEGDGLAVAQAVAARWPETKVILTSGYSGAVVQSAASTLPPGTRFLSKPYRLAQLADALRDALRQPGA
jgi:PAS domain S-box-containing protein